MKKMNVFKKVTVFLTAIMITVLSLGEAVQAEELPYDTYNYDYRDDVVLTPAAYVPDGSVTGLSLGIEEFKEPQDMCIAPDGKVYVADKGNNRVVVLNAAMTNVLRIIDTFDRDGVEDALKEPYGVCVSEKNELYIADSGNNRVVVLTTTGEFIKIVENPQSEILGDNFVFTPLKVIVDYADRIYVIAKNAFEGIMLFESNGEFTGYYGTIEVKITLWEKFWRRIASKEERSHQQLFIPTEFTGIDVDSDGFVYASNIDSVGVQAVRRLNPQGKDVIQKGEDGNVGGDIWYGVFGQYAGYSEITDVVYREKGMYSLLDRKRGRIFTYDKEGNLLYIFGGVGFQEGTFAVPVAIESTEDYILALDASHNSIMKFKVTEYGRLINEAVGLRYDGDETEAIEKWQEVLRLDENNELANTGIGKAYLTAGDNVQAMKYLKLGMNRKYYSIAWKRYRNEILADNMNIIMSVAAVLIIAFVVYRRWRRKKKGIKKSEGGLV